MARNLFGGSSDDYVVDSSGRPVLSRRVRFYTSAARTTEITDLASDAAGTGAPLTVSSDAHGFLGPFYSPDGVTVMYAGAEDASGNPPTYVVAIYTHSSSAAGVASFNTRTGPVTLSKADVTGTGLAAADIGADAAGAATTVQTNLTSEVTRAQAAEAALGGGMQFRTAVVVATTNQALSGLPTVDGLTLTAGQVILLTAQTAGSQNGLWAVAVGAWARPSNFAAGADATATSVLVESGTAGGGTTYAVTGTSSNVIGTNVLTFVKTSGSAASSALVDQGTWVTGHAYAVGDVVSYAGIRYAAKTAHTSGTFATDLAANWTATSALDAQVKAHVDQFGAKRDARQVFDAAYDGATTITSATAAFTAADVGKIVAYVTIPAGVAESTYRTGTIASVNSATSITISGGIGGAGASSSAQLIIGSDEQAAFNAAVTWMQTNKGLCLVPDGLYLISQPITWPFLDTSTTGKDWPVMGFIGQTPPQQVRCERNKHIPPTSGAVIVGTAPWTQPLMTVAAGGESGINVVLRRLSFRHLPTNSAHGLSLGNVGNADLDEVTVEIQTPMENLTDPTGRGNPIGIEMPKNFNGAFSVATRCQVVGFGHGFWVYEHSNLEACSTYACNVGYYAKPMDHAARAGRLGAYWSQYPVMFNEGIAHFDVQQLAVEDITSTQPTWQRITNHVYDPTNYGRGTLRIHRVLSGTGAQDSGLSFNGAKNLTVTTTDSNQTTLNGTTAGTAKMAMDHSGPDGRKYLVFLSGYQNSTVTAQTITFPIAFANTPYLAKDDSAGSTVSTTTLTLPASMGTTKTGWIVVEGF